MNIHAPSEDILKEWRMFEFIGKRNIKDGFTFIKVRTKSFNSCIDHKTYIYCFEKNAIGTKQSDFNIL